MISASLLFLIGLALSAFFSGTETGFYRATRVRLLLDGLGGDPIARGLLWLTNNPALFVATTLVGNNLANYLTSLAIVLATQNLLQGNSYMAEILAPMALSPAVFVYGELLPKNLFYHSPNLLLRRGGPLFLFFALLFAPISAVLWCLGRLLASILGEAPLRVRLALARKELQGVFEEGHEAGILRPAQRRLAQSLFAVASRPVRDFSIPVARVAPIKQGTDKAEVFRMARRQRAAVWPVADSRERKLIGYIRVVDLYLDESTQIETVRPLTEISEDESHIAALIRLQTDREELAAVIDAEGSTVGLLFADQLTEPLFRGQ